MKLGTETGSFTNHLYSRATIGQPTPEVGMGATLLMWTDRVACTITKIDAKGMIEIQEDNAKLIGEYYTEEQKYEYSPNPDGRIYWFKFDESKGMWVNYVKNPETGRFNKSGSYGVRIGERRQYHDPHF